jgi:2-polyprenyl-6-methoxyphenol hydroxylase-like FAD-dependent oxidoreductase
MENSTTKCVIAGGGPAGMMLGLLLARAGVPVVVLEKHADFLRDFRGDTIHPSTLRVMSELGLLEEFLTLPHHKTRQLKVQLADGMTTFADFRRLGEFDYVAFMPQWDFLNFVATKAARYPTFTLLHNAEATGLIQDGGRVVGVQVSTPAGPMRIRAELVVAADGRHSVLRAAAGLPLRVRSAPMDVLWFRISRRSTDPVDTFGVIRRSRFAALINRGSYWQIAYLVRKGSADELRGQPIERFRTLVAELVPLLADRVGELTGWDDVSLLQVRVDRLRRWYRPGLLCIGDAAHAMSPIGGVGINLAIQDAVAAANALAGPLVAAPSPVPAPSGTAPLGTTPLGTAPLRAVQRRRQFPTRVTQAVQVLIQRRVIEPVITEAGGPVRLPPVLRLALRLPLVRALPAMLFGRGVRPERVRTREVAPTPAG